MEGVGGLLVAFLTISPLLAERSHISSWLWSRTCCIISAVPVAVGGTVSLGGAMFTIFAWC